jgi:hypothetical protein
MQGKSSSGAEQAQQQLAEHFGINISQQRLKDVYEFMEK